MCSFLSLLALNLRHHQADFLCGGAAAVHNAADLAAAETQKVMLGQTDQLHSAMISMQESSLALGMMVEVRNKLVESYQELMRMPV